MLSWFAGPIAVGAAVILAIALAVQTARIEGFPLIGPGFKGRIADLENEINNPDTGYVVRLATCRGNTDRLETSLQAQSAAVAALEAANAEATARAEAAAAAASVATTRANRAAAEILALRPVGEECTAALNLLRAP